MKYPIGIQNFEKLRKEGYTYVDKTALVYKLVSEGAYYFLSRPRRFGKSLLLSTFRAYFEGKRELFEGLAIADLEKEWKQYPVLYLDLNVDKFNTAEALEAYLDDVLTKWEQQYGSFETETTPGMRFMGIIKRAAEKEGKRVVILVDEYDKPLLQNIDRPDVQDELRKTLKAFYAALKTMDEFIQFAFLTGVTKFGKISVFSDLNHLSDISHIPQYTNICGISETELHLYFDSGVDELAKAQAISKEKCYELLRYNFDGYHFYPRSEGIYNPFSLINTLNYKVFSDYWFETGTPTILVNQLKKTDYNLERITTEELTTDTLNSIDVMNENPLPLIYQSGYLTIKEYDKVFKVYTLGFPNREVEEGFIKFLVPYYISTPKASSGFSIRHFVKEIQNGEAEEFISRLQTLFADGDYQVMGDKEVYFQNTLYVFFKLLGFYVDVERHTTDGRMDILIQTPLFVYILELKVNQTADVALQQIENKGYALPFANDQRKLFKIGINFSTETRKIDDWKIA